MDSCPFHNNNQRSSDEIIIEPEEAIEYQKQYFAENPRQLGYYETSHLHYYSNELRYHASVLLVEILTEGILDKAIHALTNYNGESEVYWSNYISNLLGEKFLKEHSEWGNHRLLKFSTPAEIIRGVQASLGSAILAPMGTIDGVRDCIDKFGINTRWIPLLREAGLIDPCQHILKEVRESLVLLDYYSSVTIEDIKEIVESYANKRKSFQKQYFISSDKRNLRNTQASKEGKKEFVTCIAIGVMKRAVLCYALNHHLKLRNLQQYITLTDENGKLKSKRSLETEYISIVSDDFSEL